MIKRKIYFIVLCILVFSVLLNFLGIINSMVSLQYETDRPEDCISTLTGLNLCDSIIRMKVMISVAVLMIYFLLFFKNKILNSGKIK